MVGCLSDGREQQVEPHDTAAAISIIAARHRNGVLVRLIGQATEEVSVN
jgi:hypothetical protein